jgi:hypothetical protein
MVLPIALLLGMFLHSLLFFSVDLLHLGLGKTTLMTTAFLGAAASHAWWNRVSAFYAWFVGKPSFNLRMYDVLTLAYAISVAYYVVWAAWYWPVQPFDAMAGIDLVAREAVNQGTINNRVFTDASLAGHLSNQPFYAPFAMLMQVMYRLMGFAYGQVWVAIVAVLASWTFWGALRQVAHPLLANILWMLLILTPELLGYNYLLQTDYLNAVYFSTGVILTLFTFERNAASAAWPAALMFAAACWSRTETILLVGLGLVGCIALWRMESWKGARVVFLLGTLAASALTFGLWNVVYLRVYLPVRPDAASELIGLDVGRLVGVASSFMTNVVMDGGLWGLAFALFAVFLVANALLTRTVGSGTLLVWIGAVVCGLLLVGTVFSSAIVEQTLRRGVFKLLPLLFLYVGSTPLLERWSTRLNAWESGK